MHGLHLSTKQIYVLRALFSIGITAFVAVGTYMLMATGFNPLRMRNQALLLPLRTRLAPSTRTVTTLTALYC